MALMHCCNTPLADAADGPYSCLLKAQIQSCVVVSLSWRHQAIVWLVLNNCQSLGQPCRTGPAVETLSCALQASQAVLSMPLVVTDWSVSPSDAVAPTSVDSTGRVLFARQGPDADSLKNIQRHKSEAIERRHKSSLKVRTHLAR